MSLIYLALLTLLGTFAWLAGRRAHRLELKYAGYASSVLDAANERRRVPVLGVVSATGEPMMLPGVEDEVSKLVVGLKMLGLVQQRDKAEGKWHRWQGLHEWASGWMTALRGWRGKLTPYLMGVTDTTAAVTVIQVYDLARQVDWSGIQQLLSHIL